MYNWTEVGAAAFGAVGGVLGGSFQKAVNTRKKYLGSLEKALKRNYSKRRAYQYRRKLGKKLKKQTPPPFNWAISMRKKYGGDKWDPDFKEIRKKEPEEILTDTNEWLNVLGKFPSRGIAPAGAAGGGLAGGGLTRSLTGDDCECP